jgi:hypothetical protein
VPIRHGSEQTATRRLDFERERITEELTELDELISAQQADRSAQTVNLDTIAKKSQQIRVELAPARAFALDALPPDLALLDQEIGRTTERLLQIERVRAALQTQASLSQSIQDLEEQERRLMADAKAQETRVDLGALGDLIESRMNTYLDAINHDNPQRWLLGPLEVMIRERELTVRVGGRRWSTQLGAASQALVLFSYHYALLSISGEQQFNYPGFVVLDFPIQLADQAGIANQENYVLEPFVTLCKSNPQRRLQVIAAGRSFQGLDAEKRIKLIR